MKTKKVTRHFCDHCGKGMAHSNSMASHEAICIRNPKRECLCCETHEGHRNSWDYPSLIQTLKDDGASTVSDSVEGCPVCILAVIVQAQKAGEVTCECERETNYTCGMCKFDFKEQLRLYKVNA